MSPMNATAERTLFDAAADQAVVGNRRGAARRDDPITAQEAARELEHTSGLQRARVLLALWGAGPHGLTDQEVGERLGILRTSAGKRRLELQADGLVGATGAVRPTDTGRAARVWHITAKGAVVARRLSRR